MPQTKTPPASVEHTETYAEHPPRRWFVFTSLVLAIVLFVACASLLIYRGLSFTDPNNVIYVVGNNKWQGATVTVSGPGLKEPLSRTLEEYNKYQVPFFLETGFYDVTVGLGSFRRRDPVALERDGTWILVSLTPEPPATQPAGK